MKKSEAFDKAFMIVSKQARYYPDGVLDNKPVYVVNYDGQHFESNDTHDLIKAVLAYIMNIEK
jgi:hypothetical protein